MMKVKKSWLMMAAMFALPATSSSVLAAQTAALKDVEVVSGKLKGASQSKKQAAGYIGQISKAVIQSGNYERLKNGAATRDAFSLSADTDASDIANVSTAIKYWHGVALDTVALDHTPAGEEGAPVNQGGPTRTSRALAMIQIAVFEALNVLDGEYRSYVKGLNGKKFQEASPEATVVAAAYEALVALYPGQKARLASILDEEMDRIAQTTDEEAVELAWKLGEKAAKRTLKKRKNDRSDIAEPEFGHGGKVASGKKKFGGGKINDGSDHAGSWTPDPNTPSTSGEANLALGAYWGNVKPFFLKDGDQFRAPVPPALESQEYADAFNQVASLGGAQDNINTPSTSTDATRFIGNYWGYDGVPLIGVPPRIYNQIAIQVADTRISDPLELARYLAMVNTVMADAAIAAWDSKFYYNFWRPVTGIRTDDGNDFTVTDSTWNPVGVSVINTTEAIRPTPPFPAYPSGHAAFGGGTFEVMRDFFGDNTSFTFVSDEFNGEGVDPFFPNVPRPFVPVRFETLTDAQIENGISRVYNGVHWSFDDAAGQEMGVNVARYLLDDTKVFTKK
ncbi:vanadium-dependent haloperoxidase [Alteromonas sp. a30]|uniref:vanadium-dependent haloperoxidase n=1 Tax=Alteromonas sp. a30 TaxID=2730917 RepID=UPI00227DF9F7|nr:vanadium-dependent haloperoxidase [Alteromonas sp. a30]MCY7294900.1 phosphatase PAP2 family protein [Alteromonas sp. a30]